MTPAHRDQHSQRIWPDQLRPTRRATDLAARTAAAFRRTRAAIAAFASPPGLIVAPDGTTYRPLTSTPLDRALSQAGPGYLDFTVSFAPSDRQPDAAPPRRPMRIRATKARRFADLEPEAPPHRRVTQAAAAAARPGDRVIIIGAGTGHIAAALAEHVGPSGAVTAFEADAQSVAFARARHAIPNTAHERLGRSTLSAEPANAAETILVTPLAPDQDPTELWARLTTPGRLILAGRHADLAEPLRTLFNARVSRAAPTADPDETDIVLAQKLPARVASDA